MPRSMPLLRRHRRDWVRLPTRTVGTSFLALLAVTGCTGAAPTAPATTSASPQAASTPSAATPQPTPSASPTPRATTPTTVAGWDKKACVDFQTFYLDLEKDTPHALGILRPRRRRCRPTLSTQRRPAQGSSSMTRTIWSATSARRPGCLMGTFTALPSSTW